MDFLSFINKNIIMSSFKSSRKLVSVFMKMQIRILANWNNELKLKLYISIKVLHWSFRIVGK